jgi:uncharacterized membrane protein
MIEIMRTILGGIFFFLIPGMAWCLLIFRKEGLDVLELASLSIALSISLSTLSIFLLNSWFGVNITFLNVVLILLVLTIIPLSIRMLKNGVIDIHNHRSGDGKKDL